jgi:hypothetical protein
VAKRKREPRKIDPNKFYLEGGVVYGPGDGFEDVSEMELSSDETQVTTEEGGRVGTRSTGSGDAGSVDYSDWSREELAAEAEKRNLTVKRTDGREDLEPRLSDYVAALEG